MESGADRNHPTAVQRLVQYPLPTSPPSRPFPHRPTAVRAVPALEAVLEQEEEAAQAAASMHLCEPEQEEQAVQALAAMHLDESERLSVVLEPPMDPRS